MTTDINYTVRLTFDNGEEGLFDVKPYLDKGVFKELKDLHVFTGKRSEVTAPVVAVLGTDCACGKRTTAVELNNTLNSFGINLI